MTTVTVAQVVQTVTVEGDTTVVVPAAAASVVTVGIQGPQGIPGSGFDLSELEDSYLIQMWNGELRSIPGVSFDGDTFRVSQQAPGISYFALRNHPDYEAAYAMAFEAEDGFTLGGIINDFSGIDLFDLAEGVPSPTIRQLDRSLIFGNNGSFYFGDADSLSCILHLWDAAIGVHRPIEQGEESLYFRDNVDFFFTGDGPSGTRLNLWDWDAGVYRLIRQEDSNLNFDGNTTFNFNGGGGNPTSLNLWDPVTDSFINIQASTGIIIIDTGLLVGSGGIETSGALRVSQDAQIIGSTEVTGPLTNSALTASRVVVSDASKRLSSAAVTITEVNRLSGVTSSVQTQLNGKLSLNTAWQPPSLADGSASNNSVYFSTTASALAYKDSDGTVHALY